VQKVHFVAVKSKAVSRVLRQFRFPICHVDDCHPERQRRTCLFFTACVGTGAPPVRASAARL